MVTVHVRKWKKYTGAVIATLLALALLAGCGSSPAEDSETTISHSSAVDETLGESNVDDTIPTNSQGIDDSGFWSGIRATDYVEEFSYSGLSIPSDIHQMTDEDMQIEMDYLREYYTTTENVTDRAIVDGDTVNIDYIGSVDGVAFESGTTNAEGTQVIAGTEFIGDFLTQIIGHLPGETITVEVTLPDDYSESELQGKNAEFLTTINYIVETVVPELTDEFVNSMLSVTYGWTTVEEMTDNIRKDYQQTAVESYIADYLLNEVTVLSIPDVLIEYQINAMRDYYQQYADEYEMDLDAFLTDYVGVSGMEELIESTLEENTSNAKYSLVTQAVAEAIGIVVSTEDVANFFTEFMGTSDYSSYEEEYGMPYLKQAVLQQMVIDYMVEHAVLM